MTFRQFNCWDLYRMAAEQMNEGARRELSSAIKVWALYGKEIDLKHKDAKRAFEFIKPHIIEGVNEDGE